MRSGSNVFPLERFELTTSARARMTKVEDVASFASSLSPQHFDLRNQMSEVQNQGARRSCSAFMAIGLAEHHLRRRMDFSEQCLVYHSTGVDVGDPFARLTHAVTRGLYLENHCPYVDPHDYKEWLLANTKRREELRRTAASAVPNLVNQQTATIRAQVISSRVDHFNAASRINYVRNKIKNVLPVGVSLYVIGTGWEQGLIDKVPSEKEIEQTCSQITAKNSTVKNCPGHALVLTGFDDERGVFFFKNSWGKTWGSNEQYDVEPVPQKRIGYGVISYEYFTRFAVGHLLTLE